jgi:hypothetical protein
MKVKKGKHVFKPLRTRLYINPRTLFIGAIFGQEAVYDHGTLDQQDWNKGGGLSFNLFTNHRRSAMYGWRWNPKTTRFEFTDYIHDGRQIVKETQIFSVHPGEPLSVFIYFKLGLIFYKFRSNDRSLSYFVPVKFKPGFLGRRIGAWFGGNLPAPRNLEFTEYQNQIQ